MADQRRWDRSCRRRPRRMARCHHACTGQRPANRSVERRGPSTRRAGPRRSHRRTRPTTTTRPPRRTTFDGRLERVGRPDGLDHDVGAAARRWPRRAPWPDAARRRRPGSRRRVSASASRSGSRSSANTAFAPRARAACAAKNPTGPIPTTATRLVGRDPGDRGRVEAGRQHVADEQRALVVEPVGDAEQVHVGERHAHALGLRAGEVPAERSPRRGSRRPRRRAASRRGGRTSTRRTRCRRRRRPGRRARTDGHAVADGLDHADGLVTEDVARRRSAPSGGGSAGPSRRSPPASRGRPRRRGSTIAGSGTSATRTTPAPAEHDGPHGQPSSGKVVSTSPHRFTSSSAART